MDTLRDKTHAREPVGVRQGAVDGVGMSPTPRRIRRSGAAGAVLLTGHTGFKGGWAAIWLHGMGAKVTGLALAPDRSRQLSRPGARRRADARASSTCATRTAVAGGGGEAPPDIVLHMAAQPIVRALDRGSGRRPSPPTSWARPTCWTPCARRPAPAGGARASPPTRSTPTPRPARAFAEDDAAGRQGPLFGLQGRRRDLRRAASPRAISTRPACRWRRRAAATSSAAATSRRDRLVSDIVRAVRAGQALVLRHPEATRPWQHVLDCVRGYLLYLEALATDAGHAARAQFRAACRAAPMTVGGSWRTPRLSALGAAALAARRRARNSIEAQVARPSTPPGANATGLAAAARRRRRRRLTMDWYAPLHAGADARALTLWPDRRLRG